MRKPAILEFRLITFGFVLLISGLARISGGSPAWADEVLGSALVVVPVNGTPPTLIPMTINNSAGDQYDPHVSSDWAAYTSDFTLRYYNFASNIDAQVPQGSTVRDLLPDVSSSKIVFSRITHDGTLVMVFDAATPAVAPVAIDPASGAIRLGSAIGGSTVAFIDFGLRSSGELVVHDLTTSTSVRITTDASNDQNPSLSPNGNVVAWEHCETTLSNCDIWQAVKSGAVWSVSVVSASVESENNPDTNGSLVVYDSLRASNSDLFWRPVSGGAEVQLALPGFQQNPSITGDFIAFESRLGLLDTTDIFVYDIGGNRLYQITNTPLVTEQLNDISLLPNGNLRVVWSSDEDTFDQRNVRAATFSLPTVSPNQPPGPTTMTITGGTAGQNGWYTASPSISLASGDAIISYQFVAHGKAAPSNRGTGWIVYSAPFTAPAEDTDLYAFSEDNAGNLETPLNMGEFKVDSTLPSTTANPSGTHGNASWYTSNVTIALSASDNPGGSGVQSITYSATGAQTIPSTSLNNTAATILLTAEGPTMQTFGATDAAGNQEQPRQIQISIDKKAPAVNCAQPDGQWHATDVSLGCTAQDGVSGLANVTDVSFPVSTTVPSGNENASAGTSSRQVCDVAGNCTTAGPIGGNRVDRKAPSISLTSPTATTTYTINQDVPASFTCTDGGSGVATCAAPIANGSNVDTTSVGSRTFTLNTADKVGNTATQSLTYQVAYKLCLLYDPTSAARSGSIIPIKLFLCDASSQDVSSTNVILTAQDVVQVSTTISGPVLDAGSANPDGNFRYDSTLGPSGAYIFNLKTVGLTTGTYELHFSVGGDPTPHRVQFQVK